MVVDSHRGISAEESRGGDGGISVEESRGGDAAGEGSSGAAVTHVGSSRRTEPGVSPVRGGVSAAGASCAPREFVFEAIPPRRGGFIELLTSAAEPIAHSRGRPCVAGPSSTTEFSTEEEDAGDLIPRNTRIRERIDREVLSSALRKNNHDNERRCDTIADEDNEDRNDLFDNLEERGEFYGSDDAEHLYKFVKGRDCDVDCMNSEDDDSVIDSDEDNIDKYPTFNPRVDLDKVTFEVGMLFCSKEDFKEAVEKISIHTGKTVKFIKNDKKRCRVICRRPNCPFVIYISRHEGSDTWQIRSFKEHTCTWNYHCKTLTSTVIAKRYVSKIRINPHIKCNVFRREVITDLKLHVSKVQAKKALKKAHMLVHMKEEDQFNKIWDYCLEIANTNPGSTIIVQTSEDSDLHGQKIFGKLYVCFAACKKGFLEGCRPIIGVDGCFLKGNQGGQLLTAVTLDGNNNIFPIAWAVVGAETKSSWEWFLHLLGRDLEIFENQEKFTFISDKQKGLIPAFEHVLPNVTNRFCVRHLHQNFKLAGYTGITLKKALWAAAKATTFNQYTSRMEELKKFDVKAFNWLTEKPPSEWSRSHFSFGPKCDTLLNNMCECFNAFILDARELPIISMLESIRVMVMTRILENKEKCFKWVGKLCPRIVEVLEKNIREAGTCICVKSDDIHYEIITMYGAQYVVDLASKSCSCRRWELTGIPCVHVCAVIHTIMGDCEDYVDQYYSVETYKKTYECNIMPLNGPEEWPRSDKIPPLPPTYEKPKRGRPTIRRRKAPDEKADNSQRKKMSRSTVKLHCSRCRKSGHNSSTCNNMRTSQTVNEMECAQVESREVGECPQESHMHDFVDDLEYSQAELTFDTSTQASTSNTLMVYSSRRKKTN